MEEPITIVDVQNFGGVGLYQTLIRFDPAPGNTFGLTAGDTHQTRVLTEIVTMEYTQGAATRYALAKAIRATGSVASTGYVDAPEEFWYYFPLAQYSSVTDRDAAVIELVNALEQVPTFPTGNPIDDEAIIVDLDTRTVTYPDDILFFRLEACDSPSPGETLQECLDRVDCVWSQELAACRGRAQQARPRTFRDRLSVFADGCTLGVLCIGGGPKAIAACCVAGGVAASIGVEFDIETDLLHCTGASNTKRANDGDACFN